jgi:hypothetical protein
MAKAAGNILKGHDVKLEGQFHLDVGPVQPPTGGKNATSPALAAPKVRIVENQPEFAVIEVTCCCGMKTNLKCEYAGSKTPGQTKTQNSQATVFGEMPDKQMVNGE